MQIETSNIKIRDEKPEKKRFSKSLFPPAYIKTLKLMDYNESTIKTYQQHFQLFINYFKNTDPEEINFNEVRQYILYLVKKKKYSVSSQNNAINSIKFYYTHVLHQEIDDYYLPRPKREKRLPQILNEQEVSRILKCIPDLRAKCMIFLIYSAGLTPSEVTYIKVEDIDSDKMQIFISSARSNKDRYVILSKKVLILLRKYFKQYKPKEWLFENYSGKQFPKRTLQKIFQDAVMESNIKKKATLTILKNSFAVHLIEKGVDIRYIQQMLGHKHSKTTMKYLRVSKKDLSAIKSPLDSLDV
jgi:integrase/recombinase XerD